MLSGQAKTAARPDGPRKPRVKKDGWLRAALDLLEEGGIDAVRVERLAARLGVARSGFYWHFRDRADLYRHLLDYWAEAFTEIVAASPEVRFGDPVARLEQLARMVEEQNLARYDLPMRAWARQDETVRAVVQEVIARRLAVVRGLFAEIGFEGAELDMRARLFVCYESTENAVFDTLSPRKRARLRKRRIALLTAR